MNDQSRRDVEGEARSGFAGRGGDASPYNDQPRAILFDFDGVLADTEPLHLRMFQKCLAAKKISLSKEDYLEKYLGLDDRACFRAVYRDKGEPLSPELEEELVRSKNRMLLDAIAETPPLLPGVREMIRLLKGKYYLAIVSGALESEIRAVLRQGDLESAFHLIVSAESVAHGKPEPDGFLEAIKLLNRDHVPESEILLPQECLVVEDSPWGLEAARRAEIPAIAVSTSYPPEKLKGAVRVLSDIRDLSKFLKS